MAEIKLQIKELCALRGITTAYQLQVVGDLWPAHAAKLFNNRSETLSLKTIARLCAALNCTPNDFLLYVPENPRKTSK